jgi:hypothetical protein
MRNYIALFLLSLASAGAQTITVTSPTASQSVSGYAFALRAAVASAPSVEYVTWQVDGENVGDPVRKPPYSQVWDTFYGGNGSQHVVVAAAYDSLNNVVATSSPVTFTIANTLVNVNSNSNTTYNPTWSVAVTGTNCSGTTWTGSCTLTGTLGGTYPSSGNCVFVDGQLINATGTAYSLNTALYPNGPHKLVFESNGVGGYCGEDNQWGVWERQITFSNGAAHLWLEGSARESWLCVTASTGCPTSTTLTGAIVNTDGSTEAATITSCAIQTIANGFGTAPGIVSASGCTISALANGSAAILMTEAGGLTRLVWVYVFSTNITPAFGNDGKIYNTWVSPGKPFFIASQFFTTGDVTASQVTGANPGPSLYLANYKLQGYNTVEPGFSAAEADTYQQVSQAAFQSAQDATTTTWCTWAASNGMFLELVGSGWTQGQNFWFDRGFTETYSTHGTTYIASDWGSKCPSLAGFTPLLWGLDEVNDNEGPFPYEPQPSMGSSITSVVAASGTCTVTVTPAFGFLTGYGNPTFVITGATSAGFNSVPPSFYSSSTRNPAPTFTFACPNVANGTYNSTTDPNMLFEVAADMGGSGYQASASLSNHPPPYESAVYFGNGGSSQGTYTSGITATGTAGQTCTLTFSNGGGSGAIGTVALTGANTIASGAKLTITAYGSGFSSAPTLAIASNGSAACSGTATVATYLTDYPRWNNFQTFMTDYYAATNPPLITWPNGFLSAQVASQAWMYDPRMANFAKIYVDDSGGNYQPANHAVNYIRSGSGDRYRAYLGNTTEPFLMETASISNVYGMQGYPVPIASCSGNTFTFSSPHGMSNPRPWVTRFVVPSGPCAGYYRVATAPTSTTATVWHNFGTAISANTGTVTFANGHAYAIVTTGCNPACITATSSPTAVINAQILNVVNSGGNHVACERGGIFTISGTGTALDGTQGYWPYSNPNLSNSSPCSSDTNAFGLWGSIPALSGTGGTADINADNYLVYGRNTGDNLIGPAYAYATITYCLLLGCGGHSGYPWGAGGWDPGDILYTAGSTAYQGGGSINLVSNFGDTSAGNAQQQTGAIPGVSGNPSIDDQAWGMGTGNLLAERLPKYANQPHLSSPDYGPFIEAAAHSGTPGNMLMLQSMSMNSQTPTVNLAPYLVSGQEIIRYLSDYKSIVVSLIPAGTTSDTPAMNPGGTVTYLFPQNVTDELRQPLVSARLADVAGAAEIVVRYSYVPYWVDNGTAAINCGTGTCTLPVDRNIGTIYYRLVYLSSSGAVLATSDMETI